MKTTDHQSPKAENDPRREYGELYARFSANEPIRVFKYGLAAIDVWYMKLHQLPIIEVWDKMVEMLKIPDRGKGRDSGDLICKGISKAGGERIRALS